MHAPRAQKKPYYYEIHGQKVSDEYHWLRDPKWPNVTDKEILSYLSAENHYSQDFFSNISSLKEEIFEELKGRVKLTDQSEYVKKDEYYYYSRTEEDKEYPIYCRKKGSQSESEEIYLDVNELAVGQKFTKLSAISISPQHDLLAYSIDYSGAENYTIYIKNLATGSLYEEKIEKTIGPIIWHESEHGFFYTPSNESWRHDKVMYHKIGSDSSDDLLIFHELDVLNQVSVSKSSSKEYIIITSSGHDSSEVYYFHMNDASFSPIKLISRKDKVFYEVDHGDGYFYIHTNDHGPNFRLARIQDINPVETDFEDYIALKEDAYLSSFDLTKKYLILNYRKAAIPELLVKKINSDDFKKIEFPDSAYTASGYSTNYLEDDIRIKYSSLKRPDSIYAYSFSHNALTLIKQQEIPSGFIPDEYEVERKWVKSEGGIRVPLTIFYKKALFKKDGSNPAYIYGYGSYGISVAPSFRNSAVTLADRGFVFAIAHIRGGDDLGYEWYESAKFLNKKLTFQDYIKSAEFLIDEKYTSKGEITIAGGSAGGLLIGYTINEAAPLYKAAISHVPFVDVVATMLDDTLPLTPGEFKEWGNPKDKEYFDYMMSYSPYDNVRQQHYPHLYVTAGISDPRVGYWEAAKWVARLRDHKIDHNFLVYKTNMSAGHVGASGRLDYLKEVAEDYAFIFKVYEL